MLPLKKNLTILKGKTFALPIRWETEPFIYKAIQSISKSSPCVITCTAHGLPPGWRIAVVNAKGMTELNTKNMPPKDSDYYISRVLDPNTIELNSVSSESYKAYTGGGAIMYNTPHDLLNYTARMSIKDKFSSTFANLWVSNATYVEGQYCVLSKGTVLLATTGGISGATEPTGPGLDGTVVWSEVSGFSGAKELMLLNTTNGRIIVDNVTKVIKLNISAADTAVIGWKKGIYDLELVSPDGVVTVLLSGKVSVEPEVTT